MFELSQEQLELRETIRRFAQKEIEPRADELDRAPKGEVNWELLQKGCRLGLISGFLPRKYGGTLTGVSACIAMEELGAVEAGYAMLISITGMGIAPLAIVRDKVLMDRFFPTISEREGQGKPQIWALAITEPGAGSDVEDQRGSQTAKLMTFAQRDGNRYLLNGRKCFITAGNIAEWITVFASLDRTQGLKAWTCFLVPRDASGVSVGTIEDKLGQRSAPSAELIFEDVEIPVENRVGEEKQGWSIIQTALAIARPNVGALSVGIGRGAFERALQYATQRYQGGKIIIEHQILQSMFADMATLLEASRYLCYQAASTRPVSRKLSNMAKVFATDAAMKICTDAIQTMGAYGLMRDYRVEKYFRDAKVNQIMEGANQICRIAIMEGLMEEIGYEGGRQGGG